MSANKHGLEKRARYPVHPWPHTTIWWAWRLWPSTDRILQEGLGRQATFALAVPHFGVGERSRGRV